MGTGESVQRKRFEEDTLPHVEVLWRAALWLTMRWSYAEDLMLRAMTQAYRSWHGPADKFGCKARLFRVLVREFYDNGNRRHQTGRCLSQPGRNAEYADDGGRPYKGVSIDRGGLLLLTGMSDSSVRGAIARLRTSSRLITILMMREGFSYADIAYITDIRANSVKSIVGRLHRLIPQYLVQNSGGTAAAVDIRTTSPVLRASSGKDKKLGPCEPPAAATTQAKTGTDADEQNNKGGTTESG